jgi:hypothetical protein
MPLTSCRLSSANSSHALQGAIGDCGGAAHAAALLRDLFTQHIRWDLHEDRTGTTVAHLGKGAAQRSRHLGSERYLLDRFGDMLEAEERVEVRRHRDEAARIPSREHHDRHRIGIRLGHAPEGIFRARTVLHREDADLLTGRDPADGVGHVEAHPFLAHDNGANVRRGGSLDDRVDGVADEEGHALALEYLVG